MRVTPVVIVVLNYNLKRFPFCLRLYMFMSRTFRNSLETSGVTQTISIIIISINDGT
jgi:hypothetical protein